METLSLDHKIRLCYINIEDLWNWIKENGLLIQDFAHEKEKWAKENNQQPNFFSDTELLLIYQNFLLLKVLTVSQAAFLAKTYRLEYQNICQKVFQEKKNIIIITEKQWEAEINSEKEDKKAIVLLKDEESIKKHLTNWLREEAV